MSTTRREFLKTSSKVLAGAALTAAIARPGYTAEDNTIRVALVGCGGRGTGAAANALANVLVERISPGVTGKIALLQAQVDANNKAMSTSTACAKWRAGSPRCRAGSGR